MSENNRIVHVDATLELKDYFHASFDAAKTKLIIACLIIVIMIVGFSYFFILIDEQKILWQLSPFLFGLPIVAVVGQLLRIHASYRKYIADLSESEKKLHYMFPENGDGFEIVHGKNFSHVSWESVRSVRERPRYFRLALNRSESIIIPKRFFSQSSDAKLLREILSSQFGSKAKLSE